MKSLKDFYLYQTGRSAMNILEFIPEGKEKAVSRKSLCTMTGLSDRKVRESISEVREHTVVISTDDGAGYYIPTLDEHEEVRMYRVREFARAMSILHNLKVVDALLDDMECGRFST